MPHHGQQFIGAGFSPLGHDRPPSSAKDYSGPTAS
jgi:hypothetical protein